MLELHMPEQAAQWLRSKVKGALRTDNRQMLQGDRMKDVLPKIHFIFVHEKHEKHEKN